MWLSESHFGRALGSEYSEQAFVEYLRADTIWPFSYRTRESAALYHTLAMVHPAVALDVIDRGLAEDPLAPNLLFHRIFQLLRLGRDVEAEETFLLFERASLPTWEQLRDARIMVDTVKRRN